MSELDRRGFLAGLVGSVAVALRAGRTAWAQRDVQKPPEAIVSTPAVIGVTRYQRAEAICVEDGTGLGFGVRLMGSDDPAGPWRRIG